MSLAVLQQQIADQITDTRRLQIRLDGQYMAFELKKRRLCFRGHGGKLLSDAQLNSLDQLIARGDEAEKLWAEYADSVNRSPLYTCTCPELIVYSGPSEQFFSEYWS